MRVCRSKAIAPASAVFPGRWLLLLVGQDQEPLDNRRVRDAVDSLHGGGFCGRRMAGTYCFESAVRVHVSSTAR